MSNSRIPDDEVPLGVADEALLNGHESLLQKSLVLTPSQASDPLSRRRADIDSKQERVARILEEMNCEGVILLMPAHVSWITSGMNIRGLIAENERPGIYTNGRQRWILCSNIDTQRLFDEELDGLGFQVKEWQWTVGRAALLGELVAGKPIAADRPFPNMPLIIDRLRNELRVLSNYEQEQLVQLGRTVAHALEATARRLERGDTEADIAGQITHRLMRHGVEPVGVSVAADERAATFRRAGFTTATLDRFAVLQATGMHHGLYVTASRTISIGPPPPAFRTEFDAAIKLSAIYRSFGIPGQTVHLAANSGKALLVDSQFEFEWRNSVPGYGTGRFAAEELRKAGQDEVFQPGWALVWQARLASAAIVDTLLVTDSYPQAITPPDGWPYKRVKIQDYSHDIPDILVRTR